MNTVITLFCSVVLFALSGCGQLSAVDQEYMVVSDYSRHEDSAALQRIAERRRVGAGAPEVSVMGGMVHLGGGECDQYLSVFQAFGMANECARAYRPEGIVFGSGHCRTYMTGEVTRKFCRLLESGAYWAQAGQIGFIVTAAALIESYHED